MPAVASGDLDLLRAEHHKANVRLSYLVPPILWKARINDLSIVKGETDIVFDTGSGSYFSMVEAVQEVWVGTSDEDDDVGRLRIKGISSTVGGHSLQLGDGQYLTFKHDYPLKPKFSFIEYVSEGVENWFMDDDVAYTDQHEEPPPVVVAGPHRAQFMQSGSILFNVDASSSYAIASGASISSYALSVASTAGTPTVNFNTGTGLGDITFTAAGVYWAKYTATDSNGKSQVSYRCYIIHDPDRAQGSWPFVNCDSVELENDWESGGWTASLTASDEYSLSEIPDGTLAIVWQQIKYGDTFKAITFLPDQTRVIFAGYVRSDANKQDMRGGTGEVGLSLSTIEGRLRRMFNFSTSLLAVQGTPADWYEYENWQTCGTIVHDLFLWRSTLMEVADVIGLKDNTMGRVFFGFDEGNIYDNANTLLYEEGIRAKVVCDQGGRVRIVQDQQLLIDSERSSLTTAFALTKDPVTGDYGGELVVPRTPEHEAPFVTANGFAWDGATWDADNKAAPSDYCSIAPGGKPLWEGPDPQDFPAQTISSQANLNAITGRFLAKTNNEIEEVVLDFHGCYVTVLDAAYGEQYTMSLQATDTPRGFVWSNKPLYLRNVQANYDSKTGFWETNASFEAESDAISGETTDCPSYPSLGGEIPEIPIEDDVQGALVTGSSVHYKPSLSNLWTELTAENVEDLIQDPFWRTAQASTSPSDAILIRCGAGYIKRSTDGGSTWSTVTPSTNPPNDAGDSPAPTVGNVTFNMLDASYADQDVFVAMVTWQNDLDEWRTWLYHTDDSFATDGTWAAVDGGVAANLTSWNTPTSLVTNGGDDRYVQNSWTQAGTVRGMCRLTDTKFVVCFRQDFGDPGDQDYSAYARVVDVNTLTGTIQVGAKYGPFNNQTLCNTTPHEVHGLKIFPWDDNTFVILAHQLDCEFWPPNATCNGTPGFNGWALIGYVGTVSDQIITFGSPQLIQNQQICCADDQETECRDFYPYDFDLTRLPNSNSGLIISSHWLVGGNANKNSAYAWVINVHFGSRTMQVGNYQQWEACPSVGCRQTPGIGTSNYSVIGIDANNAAIFFNTAHDAGNGTWQAYVKHVTVNLFAMTCTFGVHQYLPVVGAGDDKAYGLTAIALSSTVPINKFVFTTDPGGLESVHSTVVTRSGTTYSVDSQGTAAAGASNTPWYEAVPVRISDTKWAVVWLDWATTWTRFNARIGYENGTSPHAYGTAAQFTELSDEPTWYREFASPWACVGAINDNFFAIAMADDEEDIGAAEWAIRAVTIDLPIGNETRGQGISISKVTGSRVWLTTWSSNGGLEIIDYALPSLTESARYSLGAASSEQISSRAKYAIPFADFSGENSVMVGGNMTNPFSLGNPAHIIYSSNAFSSASLVEGGWGSDYCGMAIVLLNGTTVAVRNTGAGQAKLYMDEVDFNMALKFTTQLSGGIEPHGITRDWISGDLYLASRAAGPVMVVSVSPPYISDTNITFDHAVDEGVQAIEVL
jgi:hypothetical protein